MDNNFQEKIMAILNNPEGMEKILSLAGALGGKKEEALPAVTKTEEVSEKAINLEGTENSSAAENKSGVFDLSSIEELYNHGKSERIELLNALRPYIRSEKKDKMDNIVKAIKTIDIIYSAKNLL